MSTQFNYTIQSKANTATFVYPSGQASHLDGDGNTTNIEGVTGINLSKGKIHGCNDEQGKHW